MNIAKELKKLRKKHGLTFRELAVLSECHYSYIWKLEKGIERNPSFSVLESIFGALNCDVILEDRG